MASFCNPKVFESPAHFRKYYDRPILAGREPGATDKEVQLATERQEEMNRHCNDFILRRTNDILSDHLPPKVFTQPGSYQTSLEGLTSAGPMLPCSDASLQTASEAKQLICKLRKAW